VVLTAENQLKNCCVCGDEMFPALKSAADASTLEFDKTPDTGE
jgi:hypothetical protein